MIFSPGDYNFDLSPLPLNSKHRFITEYSTIRLKKNMVHCIAEIIDNVFQDKYYFLKKTSDYKRRTNKVHYLFFSSYLYSSQRIRRRAAVRGTATVRAAAAGVAVARRLPLGERSEGHSVGVDREPVREGRARSMPLPSRRRGEGEPGAEPGFWKGVTTK